MARHGPPPSRTECLNKMRKSGQSPEIIMAALKEHGADYSKLVVAAEQLHGVEQQPTWLPKVSASLETIQKLAKTVIEELVQGRLELTEKLNEKSVAWSSDIAQAQKATWAEVVEAVACITEVGFAKQLDSTFKDGVTDLGLRRKATQK